MAFQNNHVRLYVSLIVSGEGEHITHLLKCVWFLSNSQTLWRQYSENIKVPMGKPRKKNTHFLKRVFFVFASCHKGENTDLSLATQTSKVIRCGIRDQVSELCKKHGSQNCLQRRLGRICMDRKSTFVPARAWQQRSPKMCFRMTASSGCDAFKQNKAYNANRHAYTSRLAEKCKARTPPFNIVNQPASTLVDLLMGVHFMRESLYET